MTQLRSMLLAWSSATVFAWELQAGIEIGLHPGWIFAVMSWTLALLVRWFVRA